MASARINFPTFLFALTVMVWLEWFVRGELTAMDRYPVSIVLAGTRSLQLLGLCLAIRIGTGGMQSVGLTWSGVRAGLGWGLVWSAGLAVIAGGLWLINDRLGPLLLSHRWLPSGSNRPVGVDLWLTAGVLGPVVEELFFRGVVFGFFRRWGVAAAVAISTVGFVLAHPFQAGLWVLPLAGGLVLAVSYACHRHLLVPVTIHIFGNLVWFGLLR